MSILVKYNKIHSMGERLAFLQDLESDNTLHVIRVISNPAQYKSRYELAKKQEKELENCENIILYTVEAAFGDRKFEVTDSSNPCHLQLRTSSNIWIKENMINLGVRKFLAHIPWKYMAWIDADIFFKDRLWALRTMNELQHFSVVQPWSDALDLGAAGNILSHFRSLGYQCQHNMPKLDPKAGLSPYFGHTGFAWSCRKDFWDTVGGLIDWAILGSADHHMGWSCLNMFNDPGARDLHDEYRQAVVNWQARAIKSTHGEISYIPGRIEHEFHGSKKNRFYLNRRSILKKNNYNPLTDLIYDEQGLLQLVPEQYELERDIRNYNRSRNEDSIEE